MSDLIDIQTARSKILKHFTPLATESVPLSCAHGRTLAEAVASAIDIPSFDASAMDGFAVMARDTERATRDAPVTLRITGSVQTGKSSAADKLTAGSAFSIMTGGALPIGADCVVPFEATDAEAAGADHGTVTFYAPAPAGQYVRRRGHDTAAGQTVLDAGAHLNAAKIGLLASLGTRTVTVHRTPRVAILSTGNELAAPDKQLQHGQIYDANALALAAAVRENGAEPVTLPPVSDTLADTLTALSDLPPCDLIITTGGVSVGRHDYVKTAVSQLGKIILHGINLKPGKPTLFGILHPKAKTENLPIFALPGNPVSALVTFHLFARPAIRTLSGQPAGSLFSLTATLTQRFTNHSARPAYIRARAHQTTDGSWQVTPADNQQSSALRTLASTDALIICAPHADLPRGQKVTAVLPDIPADSYSDLTDCASDFKIQQGSKNLTTDKDRR